MKEERGGEGERVGRRGERRRIRTGRQLIG
jgi:hypothetical protein